MEFLKISISDFVISIYYLANPMATTLLLKFYFHAQFQDWTRFQCWNAIITELTPCQYLTVLSEGQNHSSYKICFL